MNEIPRDAVLFVNTHSRRGARGFPVAKQELEARGINLRRAEGFEDGRAMIAAVRQEISNSTPLIIIGGGDGTFGSVDHDFAHRDSVLGVIPLGTGNAFARDLGIKTNIAEACDVIVKGKVTAVDLGRLNDHMFLNVATVGLTTLIARNLDKNLKRIFGPLAYIVSFARALSKVTPFLATMDVDGDVHEFRSMQVVIGNGRFHAGPFLIAEDAGLRNGKLIAYALESENRADFLRLAIALQRSKAVDLPNVRVWRTGKGRLTTYPEKAVTVDGEEITHTPVDFSIEPRSLRVMTPTTLPG